MVKQEPNNTMLPRERPTRVHRFHGFFPWDIADAQKERGESQKLHVDSKAKDEGG